MLQELIRRATIAPVFILDSKGDDGFLTIARPDESIQIFDKGLDEYRKFLKQPARKIPDYVVIRPPLDEITEPYLLDDYLLVTYNQFKGPHIMIADELYMIHKGGRSGPGLIAYLTRGRAAKKTLYGATQRPAWVSGFCLSEPQNFFVFRLMDIKDRQRLTHIGYESKTILPKYHYYCYDGVEGSGEFFEPIPFNDTSTKHKSIIDKKGWI